MPRRMQGNPRKYHNCMKCGRHARGVRIPPSPQQIRAALEYIRSRQSADNPQWQANLRPLPANHTCNNSNPNPLTGDNGQASPKDPKARPVVPLPHGLGTITVPQGAQSVDMKFNCVTSKLQTGQLKDSLVVSVDVMYNPGCGPNGAPTTVAATGPAVKKEE